MSWTKQNITQKQIQMDNLERKNLNLDFINIKKEAIRVQK